MGQHLAAIVDHAAADGDNTVASGIKAHGEGADGVLIGGCWPGDCHYINGNLKARRRVALLTELLSQYGIGPERLWLRWIAASEGTMLKEVAEQMTASLKKLGPSELNKPQAMVA